MVFVDRGCKELRIANTIHNNLFLPSLQRMSQQIGCDWVGRCDKYSNRRGHIFFHMTNLADEKHGWKKRWKLNQA